MSDRETNVSIWEGAITSTLSAGATTITVDATAGVPAVSFFVVVNPSSDDREVILIDDSTTGTSLVMSSAASRGQDGTTDVEHAIGTVVGIYPVPSHWTDINDRVDAAETTLATKLTEADIDTLAELNAIVGDATLDTSSATRVPTDLSVTNAKVAAAAAIAQSKIDGLVADLAAKLALAGGTLTGALVLDAAPTVDLNPASKLYADVFTVRTATGTTDTWVAGDQGKLLRYTNAGAVTATVPPNSSVAFPVGTAVNVYSAGAGGVTVAAGAGVTIRNNADPLVQYGEVSLRKDGTDEWVRVG